MHEGQREGREGQGNTEPSTEWQLAMGGQTQAKPSDHRR